MAETGALLDGSGRTLAPMIAWHDRRGAEAAERFAAELGADRFRGRAGLAMGPTPSLFKLAWLREHRPETRRATTWLNVAELLVDRLGGQRRAERSLGSRTGWLDQPREAWWDEALAWAGVTASLLPEPVGATEPAGHVGPSRLGRATGAVLAIAGHDHLAAAVGAGVVDDGDILDSCGTAEALVRAVRGPLSEAETLAAVLSRLSVGVHVVPGRQALMAGFLGGIVLQRFLDLLGVPPGDRGPLSAEAVAAPPGAAGLRVVDATAERATLEGIGRDASPALVWRAAFEAVQRDTAVRLTPMRTTGSPAQRLVAVGGWARDPAVLAIKEEVLGPFDTSPVQEAGCRGAALIAGVAAGLFEDLHRLPPPISPARADAIGVGRPS
ncbi:MAG TPA: FGGY family carbohydrate kinase, partial [Candidatus Dormibacteraeota bacterium]|nr:FGGY family carbohydrate kinase [Candidatus Dormibacteraeota bacterium]